MKMNNISSISSYINYRQHQLHWIIAFNLSITEEHLKKVTVQYTYLQQVDIALLHRQLHDGLIQT